MPARIEFDWDPAKAAANVVKHGISFAEAMTVFADPLALSRLDDHQAEAEERWVTIGCTRGTRLLVVVHTHVELAAKVTYIRIISARKPTKRERRDYEQAPHQD